MCGCLERTDFEQFLLWEGVVVLKELILNSFYFSEKGFCGGGLERTGFLLFLLWEGCGSLERTDFKQFLLWEGVVVLKELILNSFYFGRVWYS